MRRERPRGALRRGVRRIALTAGLASAAAAATAAPGLAHAGQTLPKQGNGKGKWTIERAPRPPAPRLVIAGGPVVGPHVPGDEDCRPNGFTYYCENNGNFFGTGFNLELRAKLIGPLYAQLRGILVGNVLDVGSQDGAYSGLGAPGVGLGLYGWRVFFRAEYMAMLPFGSKIYRPPFTLESSGRVDIRPHTGAFSAGARFHVGTRTALEVWGGLVVGPRINRVTTNIEAGGDQMLFTFLAGINVSFDLIPGKPKGESASPQQPAQPQPPAQPVYQPAPPAQPRPPVYQPAPPAQPQPPVYQPAPPAQPQPPVVQPAPAQPQPPTAPAPASPQPAPATSPPATAAPQPAQPPEPAPVAPAPPG